MLRDCAPQAPVLGEALVAWPHVASTGFGRDLMHPQTLGAAGGVVELSPSRLARIGLTTPLGEAQDWEARARVLRLSLPHWARAFQINRQIEQANAKAGLAEAALDRMPDGVIVTDAMGRVVVANRRAMALVQAQDGLRFDRGGAVHAAKPAATQQLQAMIRSVSLDLARRGAGGVVTLERPSARRPLIVLVAALPSTEQVIGQPVSGAMLIIGYPETAVLPAAATPSATFGFLAAEARLLSIRYGQAFGAQEDCVAPKVIAHPQRADHPDRMTGTPSSAARRASSAVSPCKRPVAITLAAAA